MKMLRSIGLALVMLGLQGCKSLGTSSSRGAFDFVTPERADCEKAILLQTYWNNRIDCVDPAYLHGEAPRRAVQGWIPCNDVERIDDSSDFFGRDEANAAASVAQSRGVQVSLGASKQALETASIRRVLELIRGAEKSIIIDSIVFGGAAATEVLKELMLATGRGVSVIFLHDAKAALPLPAKSIWATVVKQSASNPRFLALATEGPTAGKIVLGEAPNYSDIQKKRSSADRSRILLVDTLYDESLADYLQRVPKALIGSRDISDGAAANVDESVLVQGPAAIAATLSYTPDIRKAGQAAKNLNKDDQAQFETVLQKLDRIAQGPTLVAAQGWIGVQAMESTDYRSNVDSTILARLMTAGDSIDLYGYSLDSNWPLAEALAQAMARGVRVRLLLELGNRSYALSNATMAAMLAEAAKGKGLATDDAIRWYLPLVHKAKSKASELHAKTIVVDGRWSLYGSSDFDSYAWGGAMRSYSVWVDDPALASQAATVFDRLWNHPALTLSHKAWRASAEADATVFQALEQINRSSPDKEKAYIASLLGGADFAKEKDFNRRYSVVSAKALETIRRPFPANIPVGGEGKPRCVELLDRHN